MPPRTCTFLYLMLTISNLTYIWDNFGLTADGSNKMSCSVELNETRWSILKSWTKGLAVFKLHNKGYYFHTKFELIWYSKKNTLHIVFNALLQGILSLECLAIPFHYISLSSVGISACTKVLYYITLRMVWFYLPKVLMQVTITFVLYNIVIDRFSSID